MRTVSVKVIHNEANNGPWIAAHCNAHIYHTLPDKFILTDPDLELNKNLPSDFIERLAELSDKYNCEKIGMALDISEPDKFFPTAPFQHESQFWKNRILNDAYELYEAAIDTTFCLVNKNGIYNYKIRVAGNFTATHLPWYYENPIINIYETFMTYVGTINYTTSNGTARISTISGYIIPYITSTYNKIQKQDEIFFIKNRSDDPNMGFWKDIYCGWETQKFEVFDRFLKKDKIFLDIGGWIGTTCMYAARKSKHVYVVEADRNSFQDLTTHCKNNTTNTTCIERAVFNESGKELFFGKNKFLQNSKLNDGTSQLYSEPSTAPEGSYSVTTITVKDIFKNYSIDLATVSLIKVNIEGGEEAILEDLYAVHITHSIPLYVTFHYLWWSDQNLDRFPFLTSSQKQQIRTYPFVSLLFA